MSGAGRRNSPFAVLRHVGRTTGREYRIPVLTHRAGRWFVIPLPYGEDVNWCRNVFAAGRCAITWRGDSYELSDPRILTSEVVNQRLSKVQRTIQSMAGTQAYVMLRVSSS